MNVGALGGGFPSLGHALHIARTTFGPTRHSRRRGLGTRRKVGHRCRRTTRRGRAACTTTRTVTKARRCWTTACWGCRKSRHGSSRISSIIRRWQRRRRRRQHSTSSRLPQEDYSSHPSSTRHCRRQRPRSRHSQPLLAGRASAKAGRRSRSRCTCNRCTCTTRCRCTTTTCCYSSSTTTCIACSSSTRVSCTISTTSVPTWQARTARQRRRASSRHRRRRRRQRDSRRRRRCPMWWESSSRRRGSSSSRSSSSGSNSSSSQAATHGSRQFRSSTASSRTPRPCQLAAGSSSRGKRRCRCRRRRSRRCRSRRRWAGEGRAVSSEAGRRSMSPRRRCRPAAASRAASAAAGSRRWLTPRALTTDRWAGGTAAGLRVRSQRAYCSAAPQPSAPAAAAAAASTRAAAPPEWPRTRRLHAEQRAQPAALRARWAP